MRMSTTRWDNLVRDSACALTWDRYAAMCPPGALASSAHIWLAREPRDRYNTVEDAVYSVRFDLFSATLFWKEQAHIMIFSNDVCESGRSKSERFP